MSFKILPLFFFLIGLTYAVMPLPPNCTAVGGVCTTKCEADDRIANSLCPIEGNFCCKPKKGKYSHCNKVNRQCRSGGGRCVPNGRVKYNNCPYLGNPKSCCKGQTCCDVHCGSTTLSSCTGMNGTCKAQCLTTETVVDNGCSDELCECCQPCQSKSLCHSYNGTCIGSNDTCNKGVIIPKQCTTDNCKCCVYISSSCPVFLCIDGTIIPASKRCDEIDDCLDGSDEQYCDYGCFLKPYPCLDGTPIPGYNACNNYSDCSYGEDEANCDVCQKTFKCLDGSETIQHSWVCDDTNDCKDGDDEWNCGCIVP